MARLLYAELPACKLRGLVIHSSCTYFCSSGTFLPRLFGTLLRWDPYNTALVHTFGPVGSMRPAGCADRLLHTLGSVESAQSSTCLPGGIKRILIFHTRSLQ